MTDVDSANFDGGDLTVSIASGRDDADDVLAIQDQGSGAGEIGVSGTDVSYEGTVIGTFAGGTGTSDLVISFNANATQAATAALVRAITYDNTDTDSPTPGTRTIQFTLDDGDGGVTTFADPSYAEQSGASNPLDAVSTGANGLPAPTFADIDGDGDLDAFIGREDGTIDFWENTGSATAPTFTQRTGADNPFDGLDVGTKAHVAFADLDDDGDLDALVGTGAGTMRAFENTGSGAAANYAEVTGDMNPLDGLTTGANAAPTFVDLDNDGDLDMVAGAGDGTIRAFENVGNEFDSEYAELVGGSNPFNGIDVGDNASISFADVDNDGDLDAVIGSDAGGARSFENTGSDTAPVFVEVTGVNNPLDAVATGTATRVALVDIDGDGDFDAFVGDDTAGTVRFFENAANRRRLRFRSGCRARTTCRS